MNCFGRLVKALLGDSAMSADKLGFGASIEILGVVLRLSASGYEAVPSRKTRDKCLKAILKALDQNILNAGDAQKLAGRLNWAGSYLFHRLGRAMLKPIYAQKFNKHGTLARSLLEALRWWRMVLQYEVVEERCWWAPETPLAHMFVDARGVPPRCAAVLFIDGERLYTDGQPSAALMNTFEKRADNQIMTLEILAIAVGLSTFAKELQGRKVIVFSDNTGAEAASVKGSAKCWDHCNLIHEIWSHCWANRTHIWIVRVPSANNISDLPSREEYALLCRMDAVWRPPVVATLYGDQLSEFALNSGQGGRISQV